MSEEQAKPTRRFKDLAEVEMPKNTMLQKKILTRHSSSYRIMYGTAATTLFTTAFGYSLGLFKEVKPGPLVLRYGLGGFAISLAYFTMHEYISGRLPLTPVIYNPLSGIAVFVPIFLYQFAINRGTFRYSIKMAEKYAITMSVASSYWDIYILAKRRSYIGVKKNPIHEKVAQLIKEKNESRKVFQDHKVSLGFVTMRAQVLDDSENDWKKWGLPKPQPQKK